MPAIKFSDINSKVNVTSNIVYDEVITKGPIATEAFSCNADNITTGTLSGALVGNLDASKITTGTLAVARGGTGTTTSTGTGSVVLQSNGEMQLSNLSVNNIIMSNDYPFQIHPTGSATSQSTTFQMHIGGPTENAPVYMSSWKEGRLGNKFLPSPTTQSNLAPLYMVGSKIILQPTGDCNVGIGSNEEEPTERLHVFGGLRAGVLKTDGHIVGGATAGHVVINCGSNATTIGDIYLRTASMDNVDNFKTHILIDGSNGNVGIGNSLRAAYTLEVDDDSHFRSNVTVAGGISCTSNLNAQVANVTGTTTSGTLLINTTTNEQSARIKSYGHVGIHGSTPIRTHLYDNPADSNATFQITMGQDKTYLASRSYSNYYGDNITLPGNNSNLRTLYVNANHLLMQTTAEACNVGIGTNNPAYKLDVTGDINASGEVRNSGVILTSDDRIKSDEAFITDATTSLMKLRPQTYNKWNTMDYLNDSNAISKLEAGLVAQEVFYDAPEMRFLVNLPLDADSNAIYGTTITSSTDPAIDPAYPGWGSNSASFNYIGLIPYLVKALQENKEYTASLEARIAALESV